MKKEVSVPIIIVAVLAIVGLLVYFGLKAGAPSEVSKPDPEDMKKRMMGNYGRAPQPNSMGGPRQGGPGAGGTPAPGYRGGSGYGGPPPGYGAPPR